VFSVHCAKFVPVTSSASLSESDSNTISVISWSVIFSAYSPTAKCTAKKFGTRNPTSSDSVIQPSAVPGLLHVIAPGGNRLNCSVEDRYKYESAVHKSHTVLTAE
jgi:hypothetical protein